jgi:hypothetical protein
MTINAVSGLIEWTPDTPGDYSVSVVADNAIPPADTQSYSITVVAGPEVSSVLLSSTSGYDLTTDDLTCTYTLASGAVKAATAWHPNG